MKILVRLPTWLGDTVMATPFLKALHAMYPHAQFCFVGSFVSIALLERDFPHSIRIVDESKHATNRLYAIFMLAKRIGSCDIAISLQNNFLSALLLFLTKTPVRIGYANELRSFLLTTALKKQKNMHQVQRYYHLLSPLGLKGEAGELSLFADYSFFKKQSSICVGLNTGGAFGSAKRWGEEHFSMTAFQLLEKGFRVVLLGGDDDIATNHIIEQKMRHSNLLNLTGKTSIIELIDTIAGLDLFITNDSGPMHIAAALHVPIIALFGPTDYTETSPWKAHAKLLSKDLPCAPCKKRICPLKHHACMHTLHSDEVLKAAFEMLQYRN